MSMAMRTTRAISVLLGQLRSTQGSARSWAAAGTEHILERETLTIWQSGREFCHRTKPQRYIMPAWLDWRLRTPCPDSFRSSRVNLRTRLSVLGQRRRLQSQRAGLDRWGTNGDSTALIFPERQARR